MLMSGAVVEVLGVIFLFNVRGCAERFAAFVRSLPWWLRSMGGDRAATYRAMGAVYVFFGIIVLASSIRV